MLRRARREPPAFTGEDLDSPPPTWSWRSIGAWPTAAAGRWRPRRARPAGRTPTAAAKNPLRAVLVVIDEAGSARDDTGTRLLLAVRGFSSRL